MQRIVFGYDTENLHNEPFLIPEDQFYLMTENQPAGCPEQMCKRQPVFKANSSPTTIITTEAIACNCNTPDAWASSKQQLATSPVTRFMKAVMAIEME
jgi:hypothetical protein